MAGVPQNAQTIWNYLISHGLSANATAGIEGNIEQESGGNAQAGPWPSQYGIIQWTPGNAYFSSPPSLQQQLPAVISYINANGSIADINAHASTPADAALWFSQHYERPLASAANNPNREQSAQLVAQTAASGKWPASSAVDTSANFTIPNPINLIPGLSGAGDIFTGPLEGIFQWLGQHALSGLGVPSLKDIIQRLGLILLGAALVLVGIHVLASGSRNEGVQRVDLIEQAKSGRSKLKASSATGASEAVEAAAIAL